MILILDRFFRSMSQNKSLYPRKIAIEHLNLFFLPSKQPKHRWYIFPLKSFFDSIVVEVYWALFCSLYWWVCFVCCLFNVCLLSHLFVRRGACLFVIVSACFVFGWCTMYVYFWVCVYLFTCWFVCMFLSDRGLFYTIKLGRWLSIKIRQILLLEFDWFGVG